MGDQQDKDAHYDVLVEAAKAGYWPRKPYVSGLDEASGS